MKLRNSRAKLIAMTIPVPDIRCGLHPEFSVKSLMWFQNDMIGFLEEVCDAAVTFLESIPGEEQTAR